MKLEIQKIIPNMVVHWVDREVIWTSSNYTLYITKDGGDSFNKVTTLKVPLWAHVLGKFRLPARAFRLGIRSLRILKIGTALVIADKKIFRLKDGELKVVHSFERGFGPLREGWCEDDKGNCYLGEYFLNNKRDAPVQLLKSMDDGQSWKVIRSLSNIRHIHCVQYDPFSQRIWMGTGDRDEESSISFSENGGESWAEIGSGDQKFRAVSLLFTEDYVYWGSDAPTRQNYIYHYARKTGEVERLAAVDGPVHYSTILKNGVKLFATAAEGNSEGKSAEWDKKAHIWASENGAQWEELMSWEKDIWPYIFGFGRVYFAHGQHGNNVYFTTEALRKVDGMLIQAKIVC